MKVYLIIVAFFFFWLQACKPVNEANKMFERPEDKHSFAQPQKAVTSHLDLQLFADFERKILVGSASYLIQNLEADKILLDIRDLDIDSVLVHTESQTKSVDYSIGNSERYLGAPLSIPIDSTSERITIFYQTRPNSAALQWLSPQQTNDKTHPYLFTQGQAILTRTWIPCQDSPGVRFTYNAEIQVPKGLMATMSAKNPVRVAEDGKYSFTMDVPIPAYLMALAVGNIRFQPVGERTGVYAEPGVLDAATYEFADLEKMLLAAENLYGPYLWDRYDLIVLPPSFPFGGMENPRLTFATPTIIAGDRSLTSLVAHELAHSWSGNLVTNATWEDFWLNEGFTNYFERRIMGNMYGEAYADMLSLLGFQDLQNTISAMGDSSIDTHLKLELTGRDPDDGMTDIAYEKGCLLLRTLEEKVGREAFDSYLKTYFETFQFKTIGTEEWIDYTHRNLIKKKGVDFDLSEWIYGPGIPDNAANIRSEKFDMVESRLRDFVRIGRLDVSQTRDWSSHEWLFFLRKLPRNLHSSFYNKLDQVYMLSKTENAEIFAAWFEICIRSQYLEEYQIKQLESFLVRVGRRKFLTPLYKALLESGYGDLAKSIFIKAKPNYHSVAAGSIEALIESFNQIG